MKNYTAPTADQLKTALDIITEAKKSGQVVAVHCAAGLGRTGTLVACYLIQDEGLSAIDAMRRVRFLRPGSIESKKQEMAIFHFSYK